MDFYEEHMERLYLREWIRLYSPRIVLGFIVWFLFKIRLARIKSFISPVKGDIREQLIALDQVPDQARPEVVAILDQLTGQGFVDPLLESKLDGSNRDHLRMIGVRLLARHKSGRYVASVMIMFDEEASPQRGGDAIYTFIGLEKTITTSVGKPGIGDTPGNSVKYYPESSFEDLLEHHRQAIAQRGDSYISIHGQEEMLTYTQVLLDRYVDHLVQRGYFVKVEPEEGPELPSVIDYEHEKGTDEKGPNPLIQVVIGLSAFLIVFMYVVFKKVFWGP
ncbi:MAG: hypothetical protein ABIK07_24915 [Planctomycetota bacterium]